MVVGPKQAGLSASEIADGVGFSWVPACGWCNSVGDIFFAHFGPLSTNRASIKCQYLPEYSH